MLAELYDNDLMTWVGIGLGTIALLIFTILIYYKNKKIIRLKKESEQKEAKATESEKTKIAEKSDQHISQSSDSSKLELSWTARLKNGLEKCSRQGSRHQCFDSFFGWRCAGSQESSHCMVRGCSLKKTCAGSASHCHRGGIVCS